MEEIGKLLESVSSLLWPLIFIGVVFAFRGAIQSVIESAKGRKFTLKVAGNELTMEQVTEQQRHILSDLQEKIANIEETLEGLNSTSSIEAVDISQERNLSRVLWVDDRPENNSFLVSSLHEMGIEVHIAKSTDEGIHLFNSNSYDRIISDMGRPEGDHAGIDLLKTIRSTNEDIPFYIFCGGWAAKHLKDAAGDAGANGITSSGTTLLKMLQRENG